MKKRTRYAYLFCFMLAFFAVIISCDYVVNAEDGSVVSSDASDEDSGIKQLKEGKNIIISGQSIADMCMYALVMPFDGTIRFMTDTSKYVIYEVVEGEKKEITGSLRKEVRYYIGFYGRGYNNEYVWTTKLQFVPDIVDMNITPQKTEYVQSMKSGDSIRITLDIKYSDETSEHKTTILWGGMLTDRYHFLSVMYTSGDISSKDIEEIPCGNTTVSIISQNGLKKEFCIDILGVEEITNGQLKLGTNTLNFGINNHEIALFSFEPGYTGQYSIGPCEKVYVYKFETINDKQYLKRITQKKYNYQLSTALFELNEGTTYYVRFVDDGFSDNQKVCVARNCEDDWGSSGHDFKWIKKRATMAVNGYKLYQCSVCKERIIEEMIPPIVSIKLGYYKCTYKGSPCNPKVTVYTDNNIVIPATNYTVQYLHSDEVGFAVAKVIFKGEEYKGTHEIKYEIMPQVPVIKSLKNDVMGVRVTWNKVPGVDEYEIKSDNNNVICVKNTGTTSTILRIKDFLGVYAKITVNAIGRTPYGLSSKRSAPKSIKYAPIVQLQSLVNDSPQSVRYTVKTMMPYYMLEIQYSTDKNMRNAKITKTANAKIKGYTRSGSTEKLFAKGKRYYIRVRNSWNHITASGKRYSIRTEWSNIMSVYIKN